MEVEKLKELLKFLESSGFEEVEIETKDLKLKAKLRTSKEEAKKIALEFETFFKEKAFFMISS